jgi:hypothetical protein
MLWLNGAETWVDVSVGPDGLMDSIVNLVGGMFRTWKINIFNSS